METERRFCSELAILEARQTDGSTVISGYGSTFFSESDPRTEFRHGDFRERIAPGAFDKVLLERQDTVGLFNHNSDNVLGRMSAGTLDLVQDGRGLRYTIRAGRTSVAKDVAENIRLGNITGSSFAFTVRDGGQEFSELEDGTLLRTITEVHELFDVGPVTYPAYGATTAERNSIDAVHDKFRRRFEAQAWEARMKEDLARHGLLK